jgi:spermidine/putrescine transport system ATP-binding protein
MADNIIELRHICKVYSDNGFKAVDDFNLEVKRGEFVTFLGPSGCGKTTTLRMIAGFEMPTSGEILLNGEDISQLPANKRPINTVFQRYALFPHMNIYDNIAFGLKLKKLPKEEIRKKVKRVLDIVDLEGFENRKISTLSGGQQQRIAIARALVNEPEILMLDEPLGALDLKMRQEMQIELKHMHDELGITFIYVTHDQEEALTMSDKIVVLSEGRIQQIGTPEDIYNEPQNAFVADFIGESNIFKGIMTGHMKVRFCGGEFIGMDDVPEGTLVDVVVRPEDVIITKPEDGIIEGEVVSVIFKGMHYEVTVESGKYEMVIRTTKCYSVGERIGMKLEPDGIHIMLAEDHTTSFVTNINSDYTLDFNGKVINCDLTKVIPKSSMKNNVLVDENNEAIDTAKLKVMVSIQPYDIRMSDNVEEGLVSGHIINLIYKGDHYSYVIRTEYGHDLIVDDEYLWNMDDAVGLVMLEDKMKFQLKK